MILNGVIAVILRYFTVGLFGRFGSFWGRLHQSGTVCGWK